MLQLLGTIYGQSLGKASATQMLFQKTAVFTLEKITQLGDTVLVSIKVVTSKKCDNGEDLLEAKYHVNSKGHAVSPQPLINDNFEYV